jgi:hypothetical protein
LNIFPSVAPGDNVLVVSPFGKPEPKTVLDISKYSVEFTDGSSTYFHERNSADLIIKQDDPLIVATENKYLAYETLLVIGSSMLRKDLLEDPEVLDLLAAVRSKLAEIDFKRTKKLLVACSAIQEKEEFVHKTLQGML